MQDEYDIAQVCENGHKINEYARTVPKFNHDYCEICGAKGIRQCPHCQTPIRGGFLGFPYTVPKYCGGCGRPYPWTRAKIQAAHELAQELDSLTMQERDALEKSIDDLVKDSPRTEVAIMRFKKLVVKAGFGAATVFHDTLVDVVSESVKKALWPTI
jgi:hypothetical protein